MTKNKPPKHKTKHEKTTNQPKNIFAAPESYTKIHWDQILDETYPKCMAYILLISLLHN